MVNMNIFKKLSGERLGRTVLDLLTKLTLNSNDCVGITIFGCSVMT